MPKSTVPPFPAPASRVGRRPSTSRAELEQHALRLFAARGFDEVTVEDIAAAAGIGRRTFFRYYKSKNDAVWGDFEGELRRMRKVLAGTSRETPMMDALREAIVDFNRLDAAQVPWHRLRMRLILEVPALQAHSTLMYAEWRAVVAEFAADRLGQEASALLPQVIAYACLGAAVAAYEQWLREDSRDLTGFLDEALRALGPGFQAAEPSLDSGARPSEPQTGDEAEEVPERTDGRPDLRWSVRASRGRG